MPRARLASSRFVPLAPTSMRWLRPRLDCAPRSLLDADGLGVNGEQRHSGARRFWIFWRISGAPVPHTRLDRAISARNYGTEGQRFESSRARCRSLAESPVVAGDHRARGRPRRTSQGDNRGDNGGRRVDGGVAAAHLDTRRLCPGLAVGGRLPRGRSPASTVGVQLLRRRERSRSAPMRRRPRGGPVRPCTAMRWSGLTTTPVAVRTTSSTIARAVSTAVAPLDPAPRQGRARPGVDDQGRCLEGRRARGVALAAARRGEHQPRCVPYVPAPMTATGRCTTSRSRWTRPRRRRRSAEWYA
jgi:hypothetical protein